MVVPGVIPGDRRIEFLVDDVLVIERKSPAPSQERYRRVFAHDERGVALQSTKNTRAFSAHRTVHIHLSLGHFLNWRVSKYLANAVSHFERDQVQVRENVQDDEYNEDRVRERKQRHRRPRQSILRGFRQHIHKSKEQKAKE